MEELLHHHDYQQAIIDKQIQMVIARLDRMGWTYSTERIPIQRINLILPYKQEQVESLQEITHVSEEDMLRFYSYVLNGVNEIATIQATSKVLGVPFEQSNAGYTSLYPESMDFITKTAVAIAKEDQRSEHQTTHELLNCLAAYSLSPVNKKTSTTWLGIHRILPTIYSTLEQKQYLSDESTELERQIFVYCVNSLQKNPRLVDHADYFQPRNSTISSKLRHLLWTVTTGVYDSTSATIKNMRYEWTTARTLRSIYLGMYAGSLLVNVPQGNWPSPVVAIPLSITAGICCWFDAKNYSCMINREEDTIVHEIIHQLSVSKITHENGITEEKLGIMRFTSRDTIAE